MDPDTINCVILRIHVDKNIIPSHAIKQRTNVRHGSKKKTYTNNLKQTQLTFNFYR